MTEVTSLSFGNSLSLPPRHVWAPAITALIVVATCAITCSADDASGSSLNMESALQQDWLFQIQQQPTREDAVQQIERARELAQHLWSRYESLDLTIELADLDRLAEALKAHDNTAASSEAIKTLYLAVRAVKRQIMLQHPSLDFSPEQDKAFHLYEVGIDGHDPKQLTLGEFDDIDPGPYEAYQTPYPLSEDLFLVSARRSKKDPFRLSLMDLSGNLELVYEGEYNVWHAMPVKPRTCPPEQPDRVAWPGTGAERRTAEPGFFYSADVLQGVAELTHVPANESIPILRFQ